MVRLGERVETFVESAETLGRFGWVLASLAAVFALISLYGWTQGMVAAAARVGFLSVVTLSLLVLVVVVQGWVGPWVADRVHGAVSDQ
ncbi:hypothetical protein [Halomarina rubra]|uniref:Uncharacterized protein n=1 Tax=Halomarina rubra TaxID=2071873 RepID=A0ABD6AXW0_9EURY|nr:hypothetical protein [Halomarina rubra]